MNEKEIRTLMNKINEVMAELSDISTNPMELLNVLYKMSNIPSQSEYFSIYDSIRYEYCEDNIELETCESLENILIEERESQKVDEKSWF